MSNQGGAVHLNDTGAYNKTTTSSGSANQLQQGNLKNVNFKRAEDTLNRNYVNKLITVDHSPNKISVSAIDTDGNELSNMTYEFDTLSEATEHIKKYSEPYFYNIYIGDNCGIEEIRTSDFDKSMNFSSIYIGRCVTSIKSNAFTDLYKLEKITFSPSSKLDSIGQNAFAGTSIERIDVPVTVSTLSDGAFMGCKKLKVVTFNNEASINRENINFENDNPNDMSSYDDNIIYFKIPKDCFKDCVELERVYLPWHITHIGTYAFDGCRKLTSLCISQNMTKHIAVKDRTLKCILEEIGDGAYRNCENLRIVDLPVSLINIGSSAFEGCVSIPSIGMPKTLKKLGQGAFKGCKGLTDVSINRNIETVETGIFEGCENIKNVTVYAPMDNVSLENLSVPETAVVNYRYWPNAKK